MMSKESGEMRGRREELKERKTRERGRKVV